MNECFDVGIAPKKTIYLSVYVLIKKKKSKSMAASIGVDIDCYSWVESCIVCCFSCTQKLECFCGLMPVQERNWRCCWVWSISIPNYIPRCVVVSFLSFHFSLWVPLNMPKLFSEFLVMKKTPIHLTLVMFYSDHGTWDFALKAGSLTLIKFRVIILLHICDIL